MTIVISDGNRSGDRGVNNSLIQRSCHQVRNLGLREGKSLVQGLVGNSGARARTQLLSPSFRLLFFPPRSEPGPWAMASPTTHSNVSVGAQGVLKQTFSHSAGGAIVATAPWSSNLAISNHTCK